MFLILVWQVSCAHVLLVVIGFCRRALSCSTFIIVDGYCFSNGLGIVVATSFVLRCFVSSGVATSDE